MTSDGTLRRPPWSYGVWLNAGPLGPGEARALLSFVDLLAEKDVPLVGVELAEPGDAALIEGLRTRELRIQTSTSVGTPGPTKRALAAALLASYARVSWVAGGVVPWGEDEDAFEILRHFTRLRYRLAPYLIASGEAEGAGGAPLVRTMAAEFPDDPACRDVPGQYMLGPSLLVAPVTAASGEVTFYVPDGEWTSPLTGEQVTGGRWMTETHDVDSLPLYVRPGAILAWGSELSRPDYDILGGLEIDVFPGGPVGERELCLVLDDGTPVVVTLHVEGGRASGHLADGTQVTVQVV